MLDSETKSSQSALEPCRTRRHTVTTKADRISQITFRFSHVHGRGLINDGGS